MPRTIFKNSDRRSANPSLGESGSRPNSCVATVSNTDATPMLMLSNVAFTIDIPKLRAENSVGVSVRPAAISVSKLFSTRRYCVAEVGTAKRAISLASVDGPMSLTATGASLVMLCGADTVIRVINTSGVISQVQNALSSSMKQSDAVLDPLSQNGLSGEKTHT